MDATTSINALAALLGSLAVVGTLVIDVAFFGGQAILGPLARRFGRRER